MLRFMLFVDGICCQLQHDYTFTSNDYIQSVGIDRLCFQKHFVVMRLISAHARRGYRVNEASV